LRLAWTFDAQKITCGGRSNVMIGNMGLIIMRRTPQKPAKKNQKKCKLGKEGDSVLEKTWK
jgi:hypothetical protein